MAVLNGEGTLFEVINLTSSDEEEKNDVKVASNSAGEKKPKLPTKSEPDERKKISKRDRTSTDECNVPPVSKVKIKCATNGDFFAEDPFSYFIQELSPLMKDETDFKIIRQIHTFQSKCNPDFINSCKFRDLVKSTVANALGDRKNVFLHIKNLYDTLRAYKKPKEKAVSNAGSTLSATASGTSDNGVTLDQNDSPQPLDAEKERAMERHVRKLEKLLYKIDRRIKKLQEKELSNDDLDDEESFYIMEDKFKRRFVKVWEKLCQLKGRSISTGRHIEKKIRFEGTRYPEINKQIEKFVNKRINFPDFRDIYKVVDEANRTEGLSLKPAEVQKISVDAFEDVGKELKKRRQRDEKDLFGCFLTDAVDGSEDPAAANPDLREELEKNDRVASTIEEVIAKYVEKEKELRLKPEEVSDEDSDSRSVREENEGEDANDNAVESDISRIEATLSSEDEGSEVVFCSETTMHSNSSEDNDVEERISRSEDGPTMSSAVTMTESSVTLEAIHPPKRTKLDSGDRNCIEMSESDQEIIFLD